MSFGRVQNSWSGRLEATRSKCSSEAGFNKKVMDRRSK